MPYDGRDGRDDHGDQWGGPWDERSQQSQQQRRQAALRNLARQPGPPPQPGRAAPEQDETLRLPRVAAPSNPPSRSPRQRPPRDVAAVARSLRPPKPRQRRGALPIALAALVVVIVAAGAGVWALRGRQPATMGAAPPPMPPVRSIDLGAYNFSCPVDPSWSPDGTQIALWATLGDCGNQETGGLDLAIFDARTGKLTNSITLYSLLSRQGLPTKLIPSAFAWSPDGASLSFSVGYTYYQAPAPDAPHGLVTVTLAHDTVRYTPDTAPLPANMDSPAIRIWDIRSGKLVHTDNNLAPATAYAWGADGSLTPASADAMGKGVVSIWQAGRIVPIYAAASNEDVQGPADEYVPQDWLFDSDTPRWSPDGRYLALPVELMVRVPGGPHAFPVAGSPCPVCDSTPVAPPDKSFSAALTAAEKGWRVPPPQPVEYYSMEVAWRADGKELATMLPNEDFNLSQPVAKITIFNTQSGAVVAKLSINRTVVNMNDSGYYGNSDLPAIVWSPRGSSLAALNFGDATLTLWRAE